ncbi:MAG TPA: hypothetical protein VGC84_15410, partial [Ilumatobacteraceae bacterium]
IAQDPLLAAVKAGQASAVDDERALAREQREVARRDDGRAGQRTRPGERRLCGANAAIYTGARPHVFNAIVLREGIDAAQARALVNDGKWDGILNLPDGSSVINDVGKTLGCVHDLPSTSGIDLAALCPT